MVEDTLNLNGVNSTNDEFLSVTDTDLFTHFADEIPADIYQLMYGLFVYTSRKDFWGNTGNIYNLIACLWNDTTSPYLRLMQARQWKTAIINTRNKLLDIVSSYPGYRVDVEIPFMNASMEVEQLLDSYEIASSLIDKLLEDCPDTLPIEESSSFEYPINTIQGYLEDLKEKEMLHAKVYGEDVKRVEIGIDLELQRRNLCPYVVQMEEDVKDEDYDFYAHFFTGRLYSDLINEKQAREPFQSNGSQDSIKKRAGVLRFMLESFGVRDKELCRKLIHYALVPEKPYSVATDSNDSIYSYLHNDRQFFGSIDAIKERLKYYSVDIPQGLIDIENKKQKQQNK